MKAATLLAYAALASLPLHAIPASTTLTLYGPSAKLSMVKMPTVTPVCEPPGDHVTVYGPVPPEMFTPPAPSMLPGALTMAVCEQLTCMALAGWVRSKLAVPLHPEASVTVTA